LAAGSELRQRLPLLREAINLLQGCGDRFQLARALAELSQAHHELGDFSRARMLARWATQQAEACHPEALPKQLSANHAALDDGERVDEQAEDDGAPALSDAELRVASLAALGHTNREIGRRLYITVSTVEQHLTRVYRKLRVNSRADLPAGLSMNAMSTSA
jgi:DNA-binding CsgD family transcriptional regulator